MEEIINSYTPGIILKYIRTQDFQYLSESNTSSVNTNENERASFSSSNTNIYINDVMYSSEEIGTATEEYDGIEYQVKNNGTQQIPKYVITKNLNFGKETSRTTSITGIFTVTEGNIYNEIFNRNIQINNTESATYGLTIYEIFRAEESSYFIIKDGSFRTEVTDKDDFKTKVFSDTDYGIVTNMITNQIENYGPTSSSNNRYKIDFMPSTIKKIYIEENYPEVESFEDFSNSVVSETITNAGSFSSTELSIIDNLIKEISLNDFGYVAMGKDIFGRKVINKIKTNNIPGDVNSIKINAVGSSEDILVGEVQKDITTSSLLNTATSFINKTLNNTSSSSTSSVPDCPVNFYKNYFPVKNEDALDAGALIWEKQKIKDSTLLDAEIQLNFNVQTVQGIYSENDFLDMLNEIDPATGKSSNSIIATTNPIFSKMNSFISKIKNNGKKISFNKITALWQYDNRLNIGSNMYIAYIPASWGEKNNVDISLKEITLGIPFAGGLKTKNPPQLQVNQDTPIALQNIGMEGSSSISDKGFSLVPKKQVGKTETYTLDFNLLESNAAGIAIQLLTFKDKARKNIQHTRGVEDTVNDDMIDSFYVNTWGKAPGKLILQGVIDKNMVHKTEQKVQDFQKVVYKDGLKENMMEWNIEEAFKIFLKWNSSPNRARFLDELRIVDQNTVKEYIVSMNDFEFKISTQQQNVYVFSADFDILEEVGLDQAAKKITPYLPPVPLFTPISKTTTVLPSFEDIKKEAEDNLNKGITTTKDKINKLIKPGDNNIYLKGAYAIQKGSSNSLSLSGPLKILRQENCDIFLDFCSHQIQTAGKYSLDFSRSVLPALDNIVNTPETTYIQLYITPALSLKDIEVTSVLYNQPLHTEQIKYDVLYENGIEGTKKQYGSQYYDKHIVKFIKNNTSGTSSLSLDPTKVGWVFEIPIDTSLYAYLKTSFVIQFKGTTSFNKSFIYGLPLSFGNYHVSGIFFPINIRKPYV
jgi:hypothetical protein